jgi:hypothetical protein
MSNRLTRVRLSSSGKASVNRLHDYGSFPDSH